MTTRARLFQEQKRSREELRTLGRSLRRQTPRRTHALWQPDSLRPDPIGLLRAQEADRLDELLPIRYGRMATSPFAFFRGAAAVMAWDLARTDNSGVHVQACGDAHLDNFGIYGSPERRLVFDINDFDETLPAPWEFDVKRLAASILLAARHQGWGDPAGLDSVRAALDSYCAVLHKLSHATTLEIHYAHLEYSSLIEETEDSTVAKALGDAIDRARKRTHLQAFRKIVSERNGRPCFVENPPLLVRLANEELQHFHELFNTYRDTLQDNRRHMLEKYRFRDVARHVVGVGSVGLRAYVILLEGRGDPDPLLVQVKQSVSSVLTPYLGRSGYERHGQRVVVGQRLMQAVSDPLLGWAPFARHDFYVRQLRDMKGQSGPAESVHLFRANASLCAETLGRAHARSIEPALMSGYLGKDGGPFVDSIVTFAKNYADQCERDHEQLQRVIRKGQVTAVSL